MKRFLVFVGLLLAAPFCFGQNTTTITGIVNDSDAQAWANATWVAVLVNPSGQPPVYTDGTTAPQRFTGVLSTTGQFSGTAVVGNNAKILPPGTSWRFDICTQTSAPCQHVNSTIISGTTYNVSSWINTQIQPLRFQAGAFVYAYNTTEILNSVQGSGYLNTISNTQFLWNGITYAQISSGGFAPNAISAGISPYGNPNGNGQLINGPWRIDPTDSGLNQDPVPITIPFENDIYLGVSKSTPNFLSSYVANWMCNPVNGAGSYWHNDLGNEFSIQIGTNSSCHTGVNFDRPNLNFVAAEGGQLELGNVHVGNSTDGWSHTELNNGDGALDNFDASHAYPFGAAYPYAGSITPDALGQGWNMSITPGSGALHLALGVQVGGGNSLIGSTTPPSGACTAGVYDFDLSGVLYTCTSGTWTIGSGATFNPSPLLTVTQTASGATSCTQGYKLIMSTRIACLYDNGSVVLQFQATNYTTLKFSVPLLTTTYQMTTSTAGTCAVALAGTIQYTAGTTGVADIAEICAKNSSNAYAWINILTGGGTARTCNANGCFKIDSDGTINQWGNAAGCATADNTSCTVAVTFPTSFTTTTNQVILTSVGDSTTEQCYNAFVGPTTTGFTMTYSSVVYIGGGGLHCTGAQTGSWTAKGN